MTMLEINQQAYSSRMGRNREQSLLCLQVCINSQTGWGAAGSLHRQPGPQAVPVSVRPQCTRSGFHVAHLESPGCRTQENCRRALCCHPPRAPEGVFTVRVLTLHKACSVCVHCACVLQQVLVLTVPSVTSLSQLGGPFASLLSVC